MDYRRLVFVNLVFFSLVFGLFGMATPARACASCGSGTGSPIVLSPNEKAKFYLGLSSDFDFWSYDASGRPGVDSSLHRRFKTTAAAGVALNPRAFVTLTTSYVLNNSKYPEPSRGHGWGDPTVHARYTALQQSLAEPWVPQLQLVVGHRFVGGRSIRDRCNDDNCVVQATGSGTQESELGLDLWSGMTFVKWGLAHSILFPHQRTFAGNVTFENGQGHQTVLTTGIAEDDLGKINMGLTHTARDNIRVNGARVSRSASQAFGYFLTAEYWPAPLLTIRASFFHNAVDAPVFQNRNASGQKALSLGVIKAFVDK
jgi:hypothetical protein